MNVARGRRGLAVPRAFALAGFLVLIGLGTWQIERKAWKENLIAALDARLSAAPVALPPRSEWASMMAENSEFTRVRLRIEFCSGPDALVYASGSALRDDVKSPGWFVFTPACLPDGSKVVINRGYTPRPGYPASSGAQEIVGSLRWPEEPSWFVADHDASGKTWYVRDQRRMARVLGWGSVAPFYIEQESPVPPGGLPHPSPLKPRLRNVHLQYAITWYGLAAVLAVMCTIWGLRRREQQGTPSGTERRDSQGVPMP
jgi:cytochrome oxidase assembly protein ShyY1